MTEAYAYLVRHTHRTFFGLRRRPGRTVLKLAMPIDSPEALEKVEYLLAEQLRVHPGALAISGIYLLSAPPGSTLDGLSLSQVVDAVATSSKGLADRLLASTIECQSFGRQLTATDIGLYRARALLEGLSQQRGPHEHINARTELQQMLFLVRGELANYPRIFAEGLATPLAVEGVLQNTAARWELTLLNKRTAKS